MQTSLSIEELLVRFPCRPLNQPTNGDCRIQGGYACDLLSWVISRVETTDVWFTILNSINVVAVASLADCACVMLTEGVGMEQDVLARAQEKGVTILGTDLSTWEASVALADLLRQQA